MGWIRQNVPNLVTLSRVIILLPILILMVTLEQWYMAFALYIFGSLSDWLDGFIARRWGLVTKLGSFLDPLADKSFHLTVLVLLGLPYIFPGRFVWLLIYEIGLLVAGIAGLLGLLSSQSANRFGKIKVGFEVALALSLFIPHLPAAMSISPPLPAIEILLDLAIFFAGLSLAGRLGLLEKLEKAFRPTARH